MTDFHFIRPWWLLGTLVVIVFTCVAWRYMNTQRGWARLLPEHLRQVMLPNSTTHTTRWPLLCVSSALVLTCIALAGPTWQRLPQPVYNIQAGSVVILDMSLSVYSTDISPSRLAQMRFKASDLVRDKLDGEVGLIAYAGDAFTISPLTTDSGNLSNLIRALSPDIMPTLGSYPLRALNLADQLLRDAGYAEGDIYWLTDGIDNRDQTDVADFINRTSHRVSVLAIGTQAGAPITLPDGRMLRDASDNIVIPQLTTGNLETLANRSGGRFTTVTADQHDLDYLASLPPRTRAGEASQMQAGDQWLDQGAWLVPLIMLMLFPLVRRGVLTGVMFALLVGALGYTPHAVAADAVNENAPLKWHEKLWQTPYQQADQALRQGAYEQAAVIAEDAWQRGTANYRAGNYDQALVDFSQLNSAEGFYNQGNALMQLQRYDEAVNAYNAALKRRPNWPAAQQNRDLANQLLQQQQQNQQQNQQGQQDESGNPQNRNSDQQGDQQSATNDESKEQQSSSSQQQQAQQDEQGADQSEQKEQAEAAEQQAGKDGEQSKPLQGAMGDPNSEEMQQQMQQWLNRIEDNPAELLRQKMRYEAQLRRRQAPPPGVEKQW